MVGVTAETGNIDGKGAGLSGDAAANESGTSSSTKVLTTEPAAMDNLGSYKGLAVRRAVRAAGAKLLFLPLYSPDLNPIEQVFAKLELLLRKAGERIIDAGWQRIGSLLDQFPPRECANHLRNSGYASA